MFKACWGCSFKVSEVLEDMWGTMPSAKAWALASQEARNGPNEAWGMQFKHFPTSWGRFLQKTAIRGEYFNQVSGIKAFGASRETVNQWTNTLFCFPTVPGIIQAAQRKMWTISQSSQSSYWLFWLTSARYNFHDFAFTCRMFHCAASKSSMICLKERKLFMTSSKKSNAWGRSSRSCFQLSEEWSAPIVNVDEFGEGQDTLAWKRIFILVASALFAMEILQLPSKSSKASKSYHDAQQWVLIEVVGTWCQPNHDSHEGWTVWKSRMGLRIKMERLKDAFTIVEAQVVNVDDTLNLVRAKTPCLENESLFSWLACFLPWKSCNYQ